MKNIFLAIVLSAISGFSFAQSDFTRLNVNNFGVFSELGEPLDLIAPILGSEGLKDSEVMVSIAPEKYHTHANLPRVAAHDTLALNTFRDRKGRTVLQMSTTSPILSEGIAFIAQIDWPEGRIYRQFNIDFDGQNGIVSATTDVGQQPALAVNTTPVPRPESMTIMEPIVDTTQPIYDGTTYSYDNLSTTVEATVTEYDASAFIQPYIDDVGLCTRHEIVKGDKLWEIVSGCLQGTQTVYQKMAATFNANKGAFNKRNMHSLRVGKTLLMPDDYDIDAVSKRDAWRMYREHLTRFENKANPSEVKVQPKATAAKAAAKKAPAKPAASKAKPKPIATKSVTPKTTATPAPVAEPATAKPATTVADKIKGAAAASTAAASASVSGAKDVVTNVKEATEQAKAAASSFRLVVATSTTTEASE